MPESDDMHRKQVWQDQNTKESKESKESKDSKYSKCQGEETAQQFITYTQNMCQKTQNAR